jgi:hypothetical protein
MSLRTRPTIERKAACDDFNEVAGNYRIGITRSSRIPLTVSGKKLNETSHIG